MLMQFLLPKSYSDTKWCKTGCRRCQKSVKKLNLLISLQKRIFS